MTFVQLALCVRSGRGGVQVCLCGGLSSLQALYFRTCLRQSSSRFLQLTLQARDTALEL